MSKAQWIVDGWEKDKEEGEDAQQERICGELARIIQEIQRVGNTGANTTLHMTRIVEKRC